MSDHELTLLPCPFCGGEPKFIYYNDITPQETGNYQVAIACVGNVCQTAPRTAYHAMHDTSTRAWNRRNKGNQS